MYILLIFVLVLPQSRSYQDYIMYISIPEQDHFALYSTSEYELEEKEIRINKRKKEKKKKKKKKRKKRKKRKKEKKKHLN